MITLAEGSKKDFACNISLPFPCNSSSLKAFPDHLKKKASRFMKLLKCMKKYQKPICYSEFVNMWRHCQKRSSLKWMLYIYIYFLIVSKFIRRFCIINKKWKKNKYLIKHHEKMFFAYIFNKINNETVLNNNHLFFKCFKNISSSFTNKWCHSKSIFSVWIKFTEYKLSILYLTLLRFHSKYLLQIKC